MINCENLNEIMSETDFDYFSFISDDRKVFARINSNIAGISSFYLAEQMVGKVSLEEYSSRSYVHVNNDPDILIEAEKNTKVNKYHRIAILNYINPALLDMLPSPVIYAFIDSHNSFNDIYKLMDKRKIPYVKINMHEKFILEGKSFSSFPEVQKYLLEKYYL
ncbi:MAG: hypothetical protein QXZ44_05615 [Ferroplasma sp.]